MHLTVERFDVFDRCGGCNRTLLQVTELREDFNRFCCLSIEGMFTLTHNLILRDGFLVFMHTLICSSACERENFGVRSWMFRLIILEPPQCRFVDVGAGHVFGNRETVGVFRGNPLKLADNFQQVLFRHVLGIAVLFTLLCRLSESGNPVA